MNPDILPLAESDLTDLSHFLTTGFHTPPEAHFAAPEVLRWKYLEPGDSPLARSFLARDQTGEIAGHVGVCRTAFEGDSLETVEPVPTIHIIDWLGSTNHPGVGTALMRRAHQGTPTQFGLGVSPSALVVGERIGYQLRSLVPVHVRVLRTDYWRRARGMPIGPRLGRLARDLAWRARHRLPSASESPRLERTTSFGPEIEPAAAAAKRHVILTSRTPKRLSTMLGMPGQTMTGWRLLDPSGNPRGWALTNIVPTDSGRTRTGKIVDLMLDDLDENRWRTAIVLLTQALQAQGADLALAYGSAPWTTRALEQCGYASRYTVKFHIRDRSSLIPRDVPFHMTPLEGDYAYT